MDITTGNGNDTVIRPVLVNGTVFRSNDTIRTNAGNDTINPGLGSDWVDGGDGFDHLILDYSVGDTGTGMTFRENGQSGFASRSANGINLDYINFYYIEQFTVTGTSKDDIFDLYTPNSTIRAGAGNDQVTVGGAYWLPIAGNVGTLDGGAGFDFLKLNLANQTANLTLNLRDINISGVVRATNFEQFALKTGSGNDTVLQTGIVNGAVLRANDSIQTNAGNDTINAGLGFDSVYGGDGLDHLILDYSVGDTGTGMTFAGGSQFGSAERKVSSTNSTRLDSIYFDYIERFTVTGTSKNDSIGTDSGNDIINAGAGNDIINAGAGNDIINAGDGNDILTGQAGGDILTGGIGNDTFKYEDRTYSLLSNYDVIKDLAIGSDIIDGTHAVAAAQVKKLGSVSALTETAIQQVLTTTNFSRFGASTFKFSDRTFLALNDGTAGFSANNDSIIEITGFTGNLANLAIV